MVDANTYPRILIDPILPASLSLDNMRHNKTRSDQSGVRTTYAGFDDPLPKRRKNLTILGRGFIRQGSSQDEGTQHMGRDNNVDFHSRAPSSALRYSSPSRTPLDFTSHHENRGVTVAAQHLPLHASNPSTSKNETTSALSRLSRNPGFEPPLTPASLVSDSPSVEATGSENDHSVWDPLVLPIHGTMALETRSRGSHASITSPIKVEVPGPFSTLVDLTSEENHSSIAAV